MTDYFAAAHKAQITHGEAKRDARTRTYKAWQYMHGRVARDPGYKHVTVCSRWSSYVAFKADMGEQPIGMTLDRIKGSWVYGPDTCKWSTPIEQANNTERNIVVTLHGRTQTLKQWTVELGLNYKTIHSRVYAYGWTLERALSEPVRKYWRGA